MIVPATRQRIRLAGREGLYLVVWVDSERQTADVVPLHEGDQVLTVSFAEIMHSTPGQELGGSD